MSCLCGLCNPPQKNPVFSRTNSQLKEVKNNKKNNQTPKKKKKKKINYKKNLKKYYQIEPSLTYHSRSL